MKSKEKKKRKKKKNKTARVYWLRYILNNYGTIIIISPCAIINQVTNW